MNFFESLIEVAEQAILFAAIPAIVIFIQEWKDSKNNNTNL